MNKTQKKQQSIKQIAFKIIMVGDSGTGKSSLLIRYINNQFAEQYCVTVGVQFATKKIPIDDNYCVKLQIWDTAGQQSFRSIVKTFYRNSSTVMLIYDITKYETFRSLDGWLQESRQYAPKNALFILMGTHLDLQTQRKVTKQQAQNWIKDNDVIMHFQTSAKTADNVIKAFEQISKQLFISNLQQKKGKKLHDSQKEKLKLNDTSQTQTKMCC